MRVSRILAMVMMVSDLGCGYGFMVMVDSECGFLGF